MKNACFIVVAVMLLLACQRNDSGVLSISIDVSNNTQVCLSEIAEKVERVELETTDKSLIRDIRHVEMINNQYFVRHGALDEVLMFDGNGQFVKQVGRIGRGPGEYTGVLQIAVDMENQRLLLNTREGIMVFDDTGAFVQNVQLDGLLGSPTSIFVHNKQLYCANRFFGPDGRSRDITVSLTTHNTADWKLVDSVFVTSYSGLIFFPFHLSQGKQNIYFHYIDLPNGSSGVDTLFVLKNRKLTPYLTTHFKGKKNGMDRIVMTDNYGIIKHSTSVPDPDSKYGKTVYSQYYFNLNTMKGKNSTNGFIDDFNGNNNVIITPIPNTNKFYYYIENNDYSLDLKTMPNPTLYIGTFKK